MSETGSMLIFAVNIVGGDDEVTSVLTDGGLDLYKNSAGVAFEYGRADYQTFDDLGDLDSLATFTLGLLNPEDGNYYDRPELTQLFADSMGEDPTDLDFSMLADLASFTTDHVAEINQARKEVAENYYYVYSGNDETDTEGEAPAQEVAPEEPVASKEAPAPVETSPVQPPVEPAPVYEEPAQNFDNSASEPMQAVPEPVVQPVASPEPDELTVRANEMFAQAAHAELPVFDEATRREIMGTIIEVENRLGTARAEVTRAIRQRLETEKLRIETEFENGFQANADKHQVALKTIDNNKEISIEHLKSQREGEYTQVRDQYVSSQRQALEDAYDAQNLNNYNERLNADIQQIEQNAENLREAEDKKFAIFEQEERDKFVEAELSKVDVKDLIADYEKLVDEQVKLLIDQGTAFKGQVAEVTKELHENAQTAKAEADQARTQLINFKENYNSSLQAQVDQQVKDNTDVWEAKLQNERREKEAAQAKITDYQRQIDEMEAAMHSSKATTRQLQEQLELANQLRNQLENNQSAIVRSQENTLRAAQAGQAVQPAPVVPQKSHVGAIIAGMFATAIVTAGLGIGGTYLVMHNAQSNNVRTEKVEHAKVTASSASAAPQQTSSSSTAPSSASSSVTDKTVDYKPGDTWDYYSPQDKATYKVTMSSSTVGHYTDHNGRQHEITVQP